MCLHKKILDKNAHVCISKKIFLIAVCIYCYVITLALRSKYDLILILSWIENDQNSLLLDKNILFE